jgi:hypothetical protein
MKSNKTNKGVGPKVPEAFLGPDLTKSGNNALVPRPRFVHVLHLAHKQRVEILLVELQNAQKAIACVTGQWYLIKDLESLQRSGSSARDAAGDGTIHQPFLVSDKVYHHPEKRRSARGGGGGRERSHSFRRRGGRHSI